VSFWIGGEITEISSLVWAADPLQIYFGLFLGVLTLFFMFWMRRGQPKVALEMMLWTLVIALLVISNADPKLISDAGSEEEGKTVILVDASLSMTVSPTNQSRIQKAEEIAQKIRNGVGGDIDIFYFSGTLQQTKPITLGEQTDILQALTEVTDRYLGQELRGVILITDGIDRAGLRNLFAVEGGANDLPKLPGPLTVYQVGTVQEMYDASVVGVSTGGFAFQRTNFDVKAKIKANPKEKLNVELKKNNKVVQQQIVEIDENGVGEISFTIRPLEVGRFGWEVNIPPSPLDAVPSNNSFPVVIKVVRDEVRILQVSGSPSYDQKFLRLFLKQDPSVDLISFFILRTHEDFSADWDSDELSLIAFPYERLFSEDLDTFDLVIFQNFNYKPYFTYQSEELLENIASYVRAGGAFAMTGGDRSFDLGDYHNTFVGDILPVKLGASDKSSEVKFPPQLTNAGALHPITQLASSPEESRRIWEKLPKMDGYNSNLGLVPGAAALLQHPSVADNGKKIPILAVREVDKGRVMTLSVDSSWRWSFSKAVEGGGNQAYLRFWKNSIRWLIADPEDRQVVVFPTQENSQLGQTVEIKVRTRDTAYTPVANVKVSLKINSPSDNLEQHQVTTNEFGEGILELKPTEQGMYQVTAIYGKEKADSIFAISSRTPELFDLQPNVSLMNSLVESCPVDAKYIPEDKWKSPLLDANAVRSVPKRVTISLGYTPIIFVLVALFGSLAWYIRRRNGGR
jgi:uncharacterized membrane protein